MDESRISVLVERVGDWWVAQCVEHDLATQARTLDDLIVEVHHLLVTHIASCEDAGIAPFQLPPAPDDVRAKYQRTRTQIISLGKFGPVLATRHPVPATEIRIAA